jgi:nucleoside-diphosphate-sugar epimerase
MRVLVTGATGKVGQAFPARFLSDARWNGACARAATLPLTTPKLPDTSERPEAKAVRINSPFHSSVLDNAKARLLLGWEPVYDFKKLIDEAYDYQRAPEDVRRSGTGAELSEVRKD